MTVLQTSILIIVVLAVLVALATVGLNFANAYVCRLDKLQREANDGGQTPVGRWLSRHKLVDSLLFYAKEYNSHIIDCCLAVIVLLGILALFLMC